MAQEENCCVVEQWEAGCWSGWGTTEWRIITEATTDGEVWVRLQCWTDVLAEKCGWTSTVPWRWNSCEIGDVYGFRVSDSHELAIAIQDCRDKVNGMEQRGQMRKEEEAQEKAMRVQALQTAKVQMGEWISKLPKEPLNSITKGAEQCEE